MIAAELETLGKLATKALHKKEGAPAAASPTARDAQAAGQPTSPLSPELRCVQLQGWCSRTGGMFTANHAQQTCAHSSRCWLLHTGALPCPMFASRQGGGAAPAGV